MMSRVSVIIPAREEPFLNVTIKDVLAQATGDIEVVAVLDGWWPTPSLNDDKRLKVLHWGNVQGLRPSINAGMAMATGDYLMKLDAHCSVSKGFDETLVAACGEHDLVVPAKFSLEPQSWTPFRDPWHYFYLTWPWTMEAVDNDSWGMHEVNYGPTTNAKYAHVPVDDILTFQGSAWMVRRSHWETIGPMDAAHYYFAHEAPEMGLKTWLGPWEGRCRIVKDAWYAHLHKGHVHKRGFPRMKQQWRNAVKWSTCYWLADQWPVATRSFEWLYEKFGPLPEWPTEHAAGEAKRLALAAIALGPPCGGL